MLGIRINLCNTSQEMQKCILILAEFRNISCLETVDVHIMLDEIGNHLIVANFEISLIAYLGMIREMLLPICVYGATIWFATVVK
jgi:hypothetical protein